MKSGINNDNMDIRQKIAGIDTILKLLNDKSPDVPLAYFKFARRLEKKSASLAKFWDTELYDHLELVESGAAQDGAREDDEALDDDLYDEGEETANEIKVASIRDDVRKYTDDEDCLYCDLMDHHVLNVHEIMERLHDYKEALVKRASGSLSGN